MADEIKLTGEPAVPGPVWLVPNAPVLDPADLDQTVRRYVRDHLETVRLGEMYWYSVGPTVLPSDPESGSPVPTPAYVVTLYTKNPYRLGTYLADGAVQVGYPDREEFGRIVSALVESLRTAVAESKALR
jgi:hypothetical protein